MVFIKAAVHHPKHKLISYTEAFQQADLLAGGTWRDVKEMWGPGELDTFISKQRLFVLLLAQRQAIGGCTMPRAQNCRQMGLPSSLSAMKEDGRPGALARVVRTPVTDAKEVGGRVGGAGGGAVVCST